MAQQYTYAMIAQSFRLWVEYMDTDGVMSEEEFHSLSEEKKIALQVEAFGPEEKGNDEE